MWYFLIDALQIALANLVGAAGAWVWFVRKSEGPRPQVSEEGAAAAPPPG